MITALMIVGLLFAPLQKFGSFESNLPLSQETTSDDLVCYSYDFSEKETATFESYDLSYCGWDSSITSITTEEMNPRSENVVDFEYSKPKSSVSYEDNRIPVNQSFNFKVDAIVAVHTYKSNGSGFFIRENIVMTSAHVLVDSNGNIGRPIITTLLVNEDGRENFVSEEVIIPKKYNYSTKNADYDWALIKFRENVGSSYGSLGTITNFNFNKQQLTSYGYFGENTRLYRASSLGCYKNSEKVAEAYYYTDHGMSGGPVIAWQNNRSYVVGINHGGLIVSKLFKEGLVSVTTKIPNQVNQMIRLLEMNDDYETDE